MTMVCWLYTTLLMRTPQHNCRRLVLSHALCRGPVPQSYAREVDTNAGAYDSRMLGTALLLKVYLGCMGLKVGGLGVPLLQ